MAASSKGDNICKNNLEAPPPLLYTPIIPKLIEISRPERLPYHFSYLCHLRIHYVILTGYI